MRAMQSVTLHAFTARRAEIFSRWETLLRIEPTTSPLGAPDALVHLLGQTFDGIVRALADRARPKVAPHTCLCGCNPLLAYFRAGEQAMLEALVLVQAEQRSLSAARRQAEVAELRAVVQAIGHEEVGLICSLCQRCAHKRAASG